MNLETIVLTLFDNKKLVLYNTLCNLTVKKHSINYLSTLTQYSNKSVRNLLQSIELDLKNFFGLPTIFKGNSLSIPSNLPSLSKYKEELIHNSLTFTVIVSMIFYPHKTLENFAHENFTSISTAIRNLLPLKKYWNELNIRFNINNLSLSGDERIIRISVAQLLWLISRGQNLPTQFEFENDPLYKEYQSYKQDFFKDSLVFPISEQVDLILTVFYLRTSNNFLLTEEMPAIFNDWFKTEFEHLSYNTSFSLIQEKERIFLTYTPYYSPIDFNESSQRSLLVKNILEKEDNIYTRFVFSFKQFYSSFIPTSQLSDEKKNLLDRNAVNIIFLYSIFQQKVPTLFDLTDTAALEKSFDYLTLKKRVSAFIYNIERRKDFFFIKNNREQAVHTITALLLPEYKLTLQRKKLSVLLIIEMNCLFFQPLIQFLNELQFIKIYLSTEKNTPLPDFIISSSNKLLIQYSDLESYIVESYFVDTDFIDLYGQLKRAYLKGNITTLDYSKIFTMPPLEL